ncbi:MAG: sigma-70 family RNA polymerase sigma factor [Bacteroidales bacterium]|nr:sigma-70 family RNA polymerase sigma factor [Bacteroidales bacterium]
MLDKDHNKQYNELLARNHQLILRICFLYGRHDMEYRKDLYQDIAVNLWRGMHSFRRLSKESSWVWKVAKHTAIDKMRSRAGPPDIVSTIPSDVAFAESPHSQRLDDILEAVAHLPDEDQLLVMARLDGESYVELSKRMGLPPELLRKRYSRIIHKIKEMLNE